LCGVENWTLRKLDQKYQECFETYCYGRMEKISGTFGVKYEEVLHGVKEDTKFLHKEREG